LQKTRGDFWAGAAVSGLLLAGCSRTAGTKEETAPDGTAVLTLRIGPVLAEIAKGHPVLLHRDNLLFHIHS